MVWVFTAAVFEACQKLLVTLFSILFPIRSDPISLCSVTSVLSSRTPSVFSRTINKHQYINLDILLYTVVMGSTEKKIYCCNKKRCGILTGMVSLLMLPLLLLRGLRGISLLMLPLLLLRGTIVNRTYGIHKNLYIEPFLLNNVWSYWLWTPVNICYYCCWCQPPLFI